MRFLFYLSSSSANYFRNIVTPSFVQYLLHVTSTNVTFSETSCIQIGFYNNSPLHHEPFFCLFFCYQTQVNENFSWRLLLRSMFNINWVWNEKNESTRNKQRWESYCHYYTHQCFIFFHHGLHENFVSNTIITHSATSARNFNHSRDSKNIGVNFSMFCVAFWHPMQSLYDVCFMNLPTREKHSPPPNTESENSNILADRRMK